MRPLVLSRMNQKCQKLGKRVMSMMIILKRLAHKGKKAAPQVQAAETSVAVSQSQITSLLGISNDDNINKDARFFDAIKKAFDE